MPGFHPIATFRLWWHGRRLVARMKSDPKFEKEAIEFFEAQGAKVVRREVEP